MRTFVLLESHTRQESKGAVQKQSILKSCSLFGSAATSSKNLKAYRGPPAALFYLLYLSITSAEQDDVPLSVAPTMRAEKQITDKTDKLRKAKKLGRKFPTKCGYTLFAGCDEYHASSADLVTFLAGFKCSFPKMRSILRNAYWIMPRANLCKLQRSSTPNE